MLFQLRQRYPLRLAGRAAMTQLSSFLGPTGQPFPSPLPLIITTIWAQHVIAYTRSPST